MRRFFIPCIYVAFFYAQNLAAQTSRIPTIENIFSYLNEHKWFNGAVVVGEKGQVIFSRGFGYADFSDSTLFTAVTPSDGGSNAKTLTASLVLLLAEQGKLDLQAPVQRYLSEYPYPNTSVFNLITHSTGGLPDYDYHFEKISDTMVLTGTSMLEILSRHKPILPYPPNTNFYYDSPAFDLAAPILKQVTGLTYQELLEHYFFKPLRMQSFVRPSRLAQWKGKRAKGYRIQNDSLKLYDIADREGFYGGSNIWFTATDLYKWGTSFYYRPVLSKKVLKKTLQPVFINGRPSAVRLGAWYPGKNRNAFYYWGDVFGFYSWVYWDKDRQFTIAFVNNTRTPQWVRPQLTSALIDIMEGRQPAQFAEPKADTISKENIDAITGLYAVQGYGQVEIFAKNNSNYLRFTSGMEYQMFQVDRKTFYVPGLDPWVSFRNLKEGKFLELVWSSTILNTVGKRITVSK